MVCRPFVFLLLLGGGTIAPAALAQPAAPGIVPSVDIRIRSETVDQAGLPRGAHAVTLRVRPGLRVGPIEGLSFYGEADAIVALDDLRYNDTRNGQTNRPVVADREGVLLNQLYARWQGQPGLTATIGRQTVNYDNQRWVGSVGWRQNDQTLDAVQLALDAAADQPFTASYAHVWRVNRVFGPGSPQGAFRDTDIHLVRVGYRPAAGHQLGSYLYHLDIPSHPALSSRTVGVRASGAIDAGRVRLLYAGELARQTPVGPNPASTSHIYWLVEPGIGIGRVTMRIGHERLGGDGRTALQTPLATLHAFNGWADRFLTTPADGLADSYVDLGVQFPGSGPLARAQLRIMAHEFRSVQRDRRYGNEFGAAATVPLNRHITATAKIARYDARTFATDTTKVWLELNARY